VRVNPFELYNGWLGDLDLGASEVCLSLCVVHSHLFNYRQPDSITGNVSESIRNTSQYHIRAVDRMEPIPDYMALSVRPREAPE
jgi:hypothetical protein